MRPIQEWILRRAITTVTRSRPSPRAVIEAKTMWRGLRSISQERRAKLHQHNRDYITSAIISSARVAGKRNRLQRSNPTYLKGSATSFHEEEVYSTLPALQY